MSRYFFRCVLVLGMLACGAGGFAQTDVVKPVRVYDYSMEVAASANQLYRIVVAGEKGRLATWKDILVANTRPATALALSPSGSNFAVATGRSEIEVWSLEKRDTRLGKLTGHKDSIRVLNYSPDTRYLLSGGKDKCVKIWDVKTLTQYKNLPCKYEVNAACFSPNGYFIACDQGKDIVVFNYEKGTAVQGLNGGHGKPVVKMAFSDDGKYLMSLDRGGVVIVWRLADGEIWRKMEVPGDVKDADMHHNNKYLATVDGEGKLKVWNLKKEVLHQTLDGKRCGANVHFSYDYAKESALLTHSDKRHCYIWDVESLEPAFDLLAEKMHRERMNAWNRKRPGESSEAYGQRVSDSLRLKDREVMAEAVTELGMKWRPLGRPERSAYDAERGGYVLTFPRVNPFFMAMEPELCADFEAQFARCTFRNPEYTLDERDDFGLAYLEVDDPRGQVFYCDNRRPEAAPRRETVSEDIVKRIGEEEVVLQQKLKDFFDQELAQQRLSDNVRVSVNARPQEGIGEDGRPTVNYHVAYSYEVFKTDKKDISDWAPGRYLLAESNAAAATVKVIRETFGKELAEYIKPGRNVTIKVTGSADGSPILKPLKYSGIYGDFDGEPYYLNGNMENVSISSKTGVATNSQLAFLRTYGVRHFIEQEIPALKQTRNTFEHHVFVSEERGNQFRRVSIEIIIHNAFDK